jgi:hypothetical protein
MLLIWWGFSYVCHWASAELEGEIQMNTFVLSAGEQFDV